MNADRPKVGDVFRTPDRVSGLAGLLGEASSPPDRDDKPVAETSHIRSDGKSAADSFPAESKTSRSSPQPALRPSEISPDQAAASETRIVPVVLDVSILSDLRAFAVRTELTQGMVTLRAIEANAEELAKQWSQRQAAAQIPGRLFSNTRTVHRRTEPGVQTQVRMAAADAITLDKLVTDWSAPSRSALVNEALRRYVRPSPVADAGRRTATS